MAGPEQDALGSVKPTYFANWASEAYQPPDLQLESLPPALRPYVQSLQHPVQHPSDSGPHSVKNMPAEQIPFVPSAPNIHMSQMPQFLNRQLPSQSQRYNPTTVSPSARISDSGYVAVLEVDQKPIAYSSSDLPNQFQQSYNHAKPFVFKVSGMNGSEVSSSTMVHQGTGFFVTPDHKLATAYHVVKDMPNIQVDFGDHTERAYVKVSREKGDIAILELAQPQSARNNSFLRLENFNSVPDKTKVYVFGYPGESTFMDKGGLYHQFLTISPGELVKDRLKLVNITAKEDRTLLGSTQGLDGTLKSADGKETISNANVQPGDSGAPVIDATSGNVLGLAIDSDLDSHAEAVPANIIQEAIDEANKN